MLLQNLRNYLCFITLTVLIVSLNSCDKKEEAKIPSYIAIDSIRLTNDYPHQGTASHKITDAWVYVDDEPVGVFELPARIPLQYEGVHKITISAGIKLNGIAGTRAPYPFYNDYVIKQLNLVKDSVIKIKPTTTYKTSTQFSWLEDFEQNTISLKPTSRSDTSFIRYSQPDSVFQGHYSGYSFLQDTMTLCEVASSNAYEFSSTVSAVFLELNYKSNVSFTVGLFVNTGSSEVQQQVLIINPSKKWNKIYVNFTPTVSDYFGADDFKVFFGFIRNTDEPKAQVYLDNIKLVNF